MARQQNKVVVLDRDGTVVADRHYLSDPDGLELLPGVAEGLRWFCENGYRLVVITNQSGVNRRLFSIGRLEEVHARLHQMVIEVGAKLDQSYFCPHIPNEECECRKPRLGLLKRAASEMEFEPPNAIVIGDKASDIEFGKNAGATTILISAGGSNTASLAKPDFVVDDLAQAARTIERRMVDK